MLPLVPAIAGALIGLLGHAIVSHPTESPAVNRMLDRLTRAGGSQRTRRVRALLLLVAAFSVVSVTLLADAVEAPAQRWTTRRSTCGSACGGSSPRPRMS